MADLRSNVYVATDLSIARIDMEVGTYDEKSSHLGDITQNGKAYRELSPIYYAWLRQKMTAARAKYGRKQIPAATWELLRTRFNTMQEIAVLQFGEDTLLTACGTMTADVLANYQPPTVQSQMTSPQQPVYQHTRGSLDELYAVHDLADMTDAERRSMFAMISLGTWSPPLPDVPDPWETPSLILAL
jgi:hypothetical protein